MKQKLSSLLRIIVSFSLILFLFWIMRDKIGEIFQTLRATDIPLFALSFLLFIIVIIVISFRLKMVLFAQGIRLSLKEVIYLTFIGCFFNSLMPTALGGDVVKAYYASKRTNRKLESFTSVFVDRAIGAFILIVIAVIALIFLGRFIENKAVIWSISIMLAILVIFIILLLNRNIAKRFGFILIMLQFLKLDSLAKRAYDAINSYKDHKGILFRAACLSLAAQFLSIIMVYLLSISISVIVPIAPFFLFLPVIAAMSMLPSIGGLGIREGAYVYFFKVIMAPDKAFTLSLLYLAIILLTSIIGGFTYAFNRQFRVK